jgi:hypothetical protein
LAQGSMEVIDIGKLPAMPGGSHRFYRNYGLGSLYGSTKNFEGEVYARLSKSDPHEVGLQISCGVYPEEATKANLR